MGPMILDPIFKSSHGDVTVQHALRADLTHGRALSILILTSRPAEALLGQYLLDGPRGPPKATHIAVVSRRCGGGLSTASNIPVALLLGHGRRSSGISVPDSPPSLKKPS
ncbi:hypothetical protein CCHR01_19125 [Colletotrichum chrysophilum]|uniref:Uncharacterized protein n=1 Tax=Colletotrichum chrysophilum TaxID=1836956 RepID=A0AAD8ZZ70_9PEZI|nr:hypothetical protein CCHR01_19125 [Colletotrichum chrysophilum]